MCIRGIPGSSVYPSPGCTQLPGKPLAQIRETTQGLDPGTRTASALALRRPRPERYRRGDRHSRGHRQQCRSSWHLISCSSTPRLSPRKRRKTARSSRESFGENDMSRVTPAKKEATSNGPASPYPQATSEPLQEGGKKGNETNARSGHTVQVNVDSTQLLPPDS